MYCICLYCLCVYCLAAGTQLDPGQGAVPPPFNPIVSLLCVLPLFVLPFLLVHSWTEGRVLFASGSPHCGCCWCDPLMFVLPLLVLPFLLYAAGHRAGCCLPAALPLTPLWTLLL
jgi:hypothetical protein